MNGICVYFLFFIYLTSKGHPIRADSCCSNSSTLLPNNTCAVGSINSPCTSDYVQVSNEPKYVAICLKSRNMWMCKSEINENGTSRNVTLACKKDVKQCQNSNYKWTHTIFFLINGTSSVLLLLTSLSYFLIPKMNDTHGLCIRHYTFTLGLVHMLFVWKMYEFTSSDNACITHVYISIYFVISSAIWMNLLSFSTWLSTRGKSTTCDGRTLSIYCAAGYGIPAVVVFFASINVVLQHWDIDGKIQCQKHFQSILNEYIFIPILIILLVNMFFFLDSSRRSMRQEPDPSQVITRNTFLKTVKFRIYLHSKIFITTGVIWALVGIFQFFRKDLRMLFSMILFLFSSEGILIFLVLVVARKTVLKGLARRTYFGEYIFPTKWKNFEDSEEGENDLNNAIIYSDNEMEENNY